ADTPTQLPSGESPTAIVWESQEPLWLDVASAGGRLPTLTAALRRQGVKTVCFVPLTTPRRRLGAMAFTSYRPLVPIPEDIDFLAEIGRVVALAVEATLARQELAQANERLAALTARLAEEKQYLEEEIRTEGRFGEIIGESPILRDVLAQVEAVAGTDSAVLISGETGTGKELIPRPLRRLTPPNRPTAVQL